MLPRPAIALLCALALGCQSAGEDPREQEIISVLARADESLIRTRPALIAGKYALMAEEPFAFYRGGLAIYRHDWMKGGFALARSRFGALGAASSPLAIGDPHPENFGVLIAEDGALALEPNDFDTADRAPYLWDLRRLVAGVSLAARLSNPDDPSARAAATSASRSVARAAALAYAESLRALAGGAARAAQGDPGAGEPVLADVFKRARKNITSRQELLDLTTLVGATRRLRRGPLAPDARGNALLDLPPFAVEALPAAIAAYRGTLISPPPAADFTLLDAARELGTGVASWPRVRVLLLVRGPSDDPADDLILELKELVDARLLVLPGATVSFDSEQARVLGTSRAAWYSPTSAPLWGAATWLGMPIQIKLESAGQKTVRVSRLTGQRGTPEALAQVARAEGRLLARVHASPLTAGETPAADIAAAIGADVSAFADEQADVGDAYAAEVLRDHALFAAALGRLGPTLGIPVDPADAPSPDLAAVYGAPQTDP